MEKPSHPVPSPWCLLHTASLIIRIIKNSVRQSGRVISDAHCITDLCPVCLHQCESDVFLYRKSIGAYGHRTDHTVVFSYFCSGRDLCCFIFQNEAQQRPFASFFFFSLQSLFSNKFFAPVYGSAVPGFQRRQTGQAAHQYKSLLSRKRSYDHIRCDRHRLVFWAIFFRSFSIFCPRNSFSRFLDPGPCTAYMVVFSVIYDFVKILLLILHSAIPRCPPPTGAHGCRSPVRALKQPDHLY